MPADIGEITGPGVLAVTQNGRIEAIYDIEKYGRFYLIFAARRENPTHDLLLKGTASELSGAVGYIERTINAGYPNAEKHVLTEELRLEFSEEHKDLFDIQIKSEGKLNSGRAQKEKPDKSEVPSAEDQTEKGKTAEKNASQADRAETEKPNNNRRPENLPPDPANEPPSQENLGRAENDRPETSEEQSIGDQADKAIEGFFGNGQRANSVLMGQLEDYVLEGGNPIVGALGATGLDILGGAMGFTEGMARGILDTRNLGEGLAKGTYQGVMEDLGRAANVLSLGKGRYLVAGAHIVSTAVAADDVVKAAAHHDAKGLAIALGGAAVTLLVGKGGKGNKKNVKKSKVTKLGKPDRPNPQGFRGSEQQLGDTLETHYPTGDWEPQTLWKDQARAKKMGKYNPGDSTQPDWYSKSKEVFAENKAYPNGELRKGEIQEILKQAGGRYAHMPEGTKNWLVVDHRGLNLKDQSAAKLAETYLEQLKGVYEQVVVISETSIHVAK